MARKREREKIKKSVPLSMRCRRQVRGGVVAAGSGGAALDSEKVMHGVIGCHCHSTNMRRSPNDDRLPLDADSVGCFR
jgi:hypothetical protein